MNNLRKARLRADKSQLQLMKETSIYFATISRIENGWLKPTKRQKEKLARALEVSPDWLFPEKNKKLQRREMWILFEGKDLKEDEVKKVWRIGYGLYCRYTGDIVLLHHCPYIKICWKIFLCLTKLNQVIEQNSIELHDCSSKILKR